ncbi:MAG: zinc-binding dehydrogenase [Elusimicrobia bacterium]|nr:zinc-binding dehydrogenase [Elusimicrobiota bacterium]
MKAVLLKNFGGPENLEHAEFWDPVPGPGEVVVRVRACALNHLDLWVRQGIPAYKISLPHILGCDISGEIASTGSDVDALKTGEKVIVSPGNSCFRCDYCLKGQDNLCLHYGIIGADGGHGGYAEYVKVPFRNILPSPKDLTFEEAASFPLTFLTAWHMLITLGNLKPGQTVLVLGIGSGVGIAALQVAKLMGAQVIATTTSESKLEQAQKMGADHLILSPPEDLLKKVIRMTEGQGVDIVFEHIGPATFDKSLRTLKKGGILVTCGATTGPNVELDLRYVFSRELKILGARVGTLTELKNICGLLAQGKFKPVVDKTFPLKEAKQAHEHLAGRKHFGKVVLINKD